MMRQLLNRSVYVYCSPFDHLCFYPNTIVRDELRFPLHMSLGTKDLHVHMFALFILFKYTDYAECTESGSASLHLMSGIRSAIKRFEASCVLQK